MAARTYSIVSCRRKTKRGKKDTREVPRQDTGTFHHFGVRSIVKKSIISNDISMVQVIVEKVPRSTIPDIDKKKFLVPADLSGKLPVFNFVYVQCFMNCFIFSRTIYVHCQKKNKFTIRESHVFVCKQSIANNQVCHTSNKYTLNSTPFCTVHQWVQSTQKIAMRMGSCMLRTVEKILLDCIYESLPSPTYNQ